MSSETTSIQSQFNINSDKSNSESIYEFENFRLDTAHLMLYENEQAILLAPKVVETLVVLIERSGEIVSKEEMMKRLWKDAFVEDANLTQNIYLLRKTLGNNSAGKPLIETFRRRGYRFTGELKNVDSELIKSRLKSAAQSREIRNEEDENFDSLAVLPLTNESTDNAAEYLSDGITESIINRLSQLEDFRVVARNTVFRYKNQKIEPQKIGRELGVSAILTGRILQFGERMIVRTELTETTNGWQIWGEQYDRFASDILELQEIIAREISGKLHLKLSREEQKRLSKRDTQSSEAYGFYVKGRYFLNRRSINTIEQATGYFQQAIDVDPTYALAFVGLADCYPLLSLYGALAPREAYPKAAAAAQKALEIDDKLAEAYNSLGVVKLFYEWDWRGAENAFQKALKLNPGYADAHQRYGMFLVSQSRFDEAIGEFERARELDPLSLIIKTISGYPFYYSHQFEKAAAHFAEVIATDENYSMAHFRLGLTYAQLGEFEKAIAELGKSTVLSGDRDVVAALGYVHGLTGNSAEAGVALAELGEREKNGFVSAYDKAIIYAGTGQTDNALDWLEKAFEERSYWLIYLKSDPSLDSLRSDPRFIALQEKVFGAETVETVEKSHSPAENRQSISAGKQISRRTIWFLAAACGLLMVAVFGLTQFDWREKNEAQAPRNSNISLKRLTPNLRTLNPAISPNGEFVAYAKLEENGMTSLWLRNIQTGQDKELLSPMVKGYLGLQFSPDGKQIYYLSYKDATNYILASLDIEKSVTRAVVGNIAMRFAVSPDGGQVAFVRDTDLIIADIAGNNAERTLSKRDGKSKWFSSQYVQLAWSPDSRRIVISGGYLERGVEYSELVEINVSDGAEKRLQSPPWDKIGSVVWAPDDSGLYVIAREEQNQPTQIFYLSFRSGAAQKITSDLHNYNSLSMSADSRFLVAEQSSGKSDIWLAEKDNLTQIKRVTFDDEENTGVNGLAFMPDGRIVYTSPRSGNLDLWIMNPDGTNQKQLTSNLSGWNIRPRPSSDGRYIVFQSFSNHQNNIWRMDADGRNVIQLTNGNEANSSPDITPDGHWVYYTSASGDQFSIWKVSINGGTPIRVSIDEKAVSPSISPDGKLLAVHFEWDQKTSWKVGIMSAETGKRLKLFEIAAFRRIIRWTPDSKSLIYIQNNSSNLWEQPIDGGEPRQLTNFNLEQTWNFAFSADNRRLALVRGNINTESVLISNLK